MNTIRTASAGRWPRVALVLTALVLSLAVVAGPAARPAAAWNGTPSPITIANGVAKELPNAATIATTAGRMSPWGRVATLALGAWMTYDAVTNLSPGSPATGDATKTTGPTAACWSVTGYTPNAAGNQVIINLIGSCGSGGSGHYSRHWCVSPTGSRTMVDGGGLLINNSPQTRTVTCGTGFVVDTILMTTNSARTAVVDTWTNGFATGSHVRTTTVTCRKPDGSTVQITDTLTGRPGEVAIPSCADRVPGGAMPWAIDVSSGPSWDPTRWKDFDIDVDPNVLTQYPDCFANGALSCVVTVWVGGKPCNASRTTCYDWYDNRSDPESNVQCRFGSYVIGIGQCTKFKDSFKPGSGTQTQTGTDANGDPIWSSPGGSSNPTTGPTPTAGPTASPSAAPTNGPNPESPPVTPDGDTDPDSRGCFGAAWSYNPVDWVYVPVKCALLWAFKPKVALSTRVETITNMITTKVPFAWAAGIGGLAPLIPAGNCPDWTVTVGDFERNVVCGHGYTNAIRAARPVLTGFMLALALWPLIRSTLYAAFPILKPQPGVLR